MFAAVRAVHFALFDDIRRQTYGFTTIRASYLKIGIVKLVQLVVLILAAAASVTAILVIVQAVNFLFQRTEILVNLVQLIGNLTGLHFQIADAQCQVIQQLENSVEQFHFFFVGIQLQAFCQAAQISGALRNRHDNDLPFSGTA